MQDMVGLWNQGLERTAPIFERLHVMSLAVPDAK